MTPAIPWRRWTPALLTSLRAYDSGAFLRDLIAGVTVGLVALPLAMAFGIASGVSPQAGIYTAILGGFLVSALGGCTIQVGGPTGAFVVIVAGILVQHGQAGLLMVTMMAGVILLFLAFSGLGTAVKFIPRPIVVGFTNGIGLLIASTQIKDFFGLQMAAPPSEFLERMRAYTEHSGTMQWSAVLLGLGSLGLIVALPRLSGKVPGSIAALVAGTGAAVLLDLPVETVGSRFGGIPSALPAVAIPAFQPELLLPLLPSALTVALLAAIESLLSAVVADGMTGARHNSNAELMAQGAANLLVPLVGGIPVTGAIARTATNFRAGGRTPVAGMVHAATLLGVILLAAPLAKYIPLATLAAILFTVAYHMGEWREIPGILRLDLAEKSVWGITLLLTVFADLTVAVAVGMTLAALLYIYRVSETTTVTRVTEDYVQHGIVHSLQHHSLPDYVSVVRIHGPFLFGTADKLAEETADVESLAPVVILRLRNMTAIDATGLHALEKLAERLKRAGRTLLLCGARAQPRKFLHNAQFVGHIGEANILPHLQAALRRAAEIHGKAVNR